MSRDAGRLGAPRGGRSPRRGWSGVAIAAGALCLAVSAPVSPPAGAPATFPPDFLAQLRHVKEIYVATVRKNGTRSSVAPVWFAVVDNAIWIDTGPHTYKARRVRHGSPLLVSARGKDGPFVKTQAEIVTDGAMADRLGRLYARKYWIAWLGLFRPSRARVESGQIVLMRLTPAP